jgi:Flp pilus assembly protein TadD/TolB-like protein
VFCRRTRTAVFTILLIAVVAGGGCARQPVRNAQIAERLAVLPLENLSSDPQWNWYALASAAVVEYDLAGAKEILATTAESPSAAQAMQASRVLEGYFFERNGRIGIRATVEDLRKTRAVEHFEIEGPIADGFLPLANELAHRVSSEARRFGTNKESAFRFYGEALMASDGEARQQALESAMAADPGFAASYLGEARLLAETGARDRALQVIQAGEREQLDAIDRADLQYVAAAASGDANTRIEALEALARVRPANATLVADLGAAQFARRNFPESVRNYQAASLLNPEEPRTWNELGYALAWTRNLNGARQAIQEYEKLVPDDANALDSLGEVSFFLGDFGAAEKYFERAAQKSPAEFLKAAEARLMTGDLQAADALFGKYVAVLPRERAAYHLAQWQFLTGRGTASMRDAEPLADLARTRVLSAYRLLLAQKYREALPLLHGLYEETNPSSDGQIRVLLAWALVETGRFDEAGKLLEMCPLPLSAGDPMFASLIFPRYFSLRAAVLEKQGKSDEAKKNRELYRKYSGGEVTK